MLIDASDATTIPTEIKNKIVNWFASLPQNVNCNIKTFKDMHGQNVTWAIDEYVESGLKYGFYDELIALFEKHNMICYHSTKVYDKETILSDGLRTNEWDTYSRNISKTLQILGMEEKEIAEIIEIIKREYDRKYTSHGREAQLCFYSDMELLSKGIRAGYERFCENIGGELARDALQKDYPELYKNLRENGEAYLIKFKIPFLHINSYNKESVIKPFIDYVGGKYFWNTNLEIHFDGDTNKAVLPCDILELIPYTINRYYFNK